MVSISVFKQKTTSKKSIKRRIHSTGTIQIRSLELVLKQILIYDYCCEPLRSSLLRATIIHLNRPIKGVTLFKFSIMVCTDPLLVINDLFSSSLQPQYRVELMSPEMPYLNFKSGNIKSNCCYYLNSSSGSARSDDILVAMRFYNVRYKECFRDTCSHQSNCVATNFVSANIVFLFTIQLIQKLQIKTTFVIPKSATD